MTPIGRLEAKNSFGGTTYIVDLEKTYKILIEEDNKGNLIVKNYKRGIFKDKLLYSFTHDYNWNEVVPMMITKLKSYTNIHEKVCFSDNYWCITAERCLDTFKKFTK